MASNLYRLFTTIPDQTKLVINDMLYTVGYRLEWLRPMPAAVFQPDPDSFVPPSPPLTDKELHALDWFLIELKRSELSVIRQFNEELAPDGFRILREKVTTEWVAP